MGDEPLFPIGGGDVGALLVSERFKCALTVFCRSIRSYRLEKNVLKHIESLYAHERISLTLMKECEEYFVAHYI